MNHNLQNNIVNLEKGEPIEENTFPIFTEGKTWINLNRTSNLSCVSFV